MPIIAMGAVRGVFAVSEQDKKIELTVAPGVVLILSRHAESAPCGFQAILMFIGSPKHYFYNPAFDVKMLLLVVAVLVQAVLFRWVSRSDNPSPWLTRTTVAVSLASWFAVSMAGGVPAGRGSGARPMAEDGPPEIGEPDVTWPVLAFIVPMPAAPLPM